MEDRGGEGAVVCDDLVVDLVDVGQVTLSSWLIVNVDGEKPVLLI